MKEFAMNIDEFSIGQFVVHSNGYNYEIINKTINSIEVYMTKNTN